MASESDSNYLDVSDNLLNIFHNVNNAIMGSFLACLGIIGNLMNMAVFHRQGFADTVNISLFALSLSDLFSLITLQVCNLFRNELFLNAVVVIPMEGQYLVGGWPHVILTRVSGAITAYITFERCLCVLLPLKVKIILTPKFTVQVLALITLVLLATVLPDYATCYYGWKWDVKRNRTAFGILYIGDRHTMVYVTFVMGGVTQLLAFLAVVLFTAILVVKLQQKSKWRASTSSSSLASEKKQARDKRTVLMIVMIAIIYCICFLPHIVFYAVTTVLPEFNISRKYNNAFSSSWSFAMLIDSVNATVNTLVYYRMSSKYRNTFHILFAFVRRSKVENSDDNDGAVLSG